MYIFFYNNIGKALIYKSQYHCAYIYHFPVTRVKMTTFGRNTQLIWELNTVYRRVLTGFIPFLWKTFCLLRMQFAVRFNNNVWLYDIENDAKIITNNKYMYVNISKEQTMISFQKKPSKTVENMWPGLHVILKEFQICAYPHPTIRSKGVIVVQICWIWSSFLIMGSIDLSLQTASQNYSARSLTSTLKSL